MRRQLDGKKSSRNGEKLIHVCIVYAIYVAAAVVANAIAIVFLRRLFCTLCVCIMYIYMDLMYYVSCLTKKDDFEQEKQRLHKDHAAKSRNQHVAEMSNDVIRQDIAKRFLRNLHQPSDFDVEIEIHWVNTTRIILNSSIVRERVRVRVRLGVSVFRGRMPMIQSNAKCINQLINCAWNYKRTKELNCSARSFVRYRQTVCFCVCFFLDFAFASQPHNQPKSYQLCVHLEPIC